MNRSRDTSSPHGANELSKDSDNDAAVDAKPCSETKYRSSVNLHAGLGHVYKPHFNHPYNPLSIPGAIAVLADSYLTPKGIADPTMKRAADKDEPSSAKKPRNNDYLTDPRRSEQFPESPWNERGGGAMHATFRPEPCVNPAAAAAAPLRPRDPYFFAQQCGTPDVLNGASSNKDNNEPVSVVPRASYPEHLQGISHPYALSQAEYSLEFLHQQLAVSHHAAANAALLSQLSGRRGLESLIPPGFPLPGLQGFAAQQYPQSFPSLHRVGATASARGGNHLDPFQLPTFSNAAHRNAAFSSLLAASEWEQHQHQQRQQHEQDISAILARHMAARGDGLSQDAQATLHAQHRQRVGSNTQQHRSYEHQRGPQDHRQQDQQQYQEQNQHPRLELPGALDLPPCSEGQLESFLTRPCFPLAIDEDPNWLSEFHCFVRSELVEVFRSNQSDVRSRNNSIGYQQVGIRCRFCAHLSPTARVGRSSAFPSSMRQIYQSFTMMLRDHFGNCNAMPTGIQDKFVLLKDKPSQGATDSKRYWTYSAQKTGMRDSAEGLTINAASRAAGLRTDPFGIVQGQRWDDDIRSHIPLLLPSDRPFVPEFLFLLLSQAQPIRLMESECIGNRRNLRLGMPGFGCRYCCQHRRLGLSRMFPARRRTLPGKVSDLYTHLARCHVCPQDVKEKLEDSRQRMESGFQADQGGTRDFFNRVWIRMGHDGNADSDDAP